MGKGWLIGKKEKWGIFLFIAGCFLVSRFIMLWAVQGVSGSWDIRNAVVYLNRADAAWYAEYTKAIMTGGQLPVYENGQAAWAFFPLYPLLTGLFNKMLPFLTVYEAGSLLSSLFLMAAEYIGYLYIRLTRKSRSLPYVYIFLMSFGPYSFYFSILYTEALFLLLLTLCFYHMEKKEYLRMGLCGALLCATRNVGVLFCFALLVWWIIRWHRETTGKRNIGGFFRESFGNARLLLGAVLIPLGLFAYMLWLKYTTGDAFAFFHAQRAWGKENLGFFTVLSDLLTREFPPHYWGVSMVAALGAIAYMLTNRRTAEAVFPLLVLIVAGMSSGMSVPRYMMGTFTVMLAVSEYTDRRHPVFKYGIPLLLAGYEVLLVQTWAAGINMDLIY